MFDVISIGGATLDVFIHCPDLEHAEIDGKKKITLPFGGKVEVGNVLFETGGGATNTATTFTRQGLKAAVVAKIGKDFSGEKVIKRLQDESINTNFVVQDPNDTTDFSTIIWREGQGNALLVSRGKGKLEITDEHWEQMTPKWFYISSVEGNIDIIKKVTEIKKDAQLRQGYDGQAKIAWNPGKMELSLKEKITELLPSIELFVLNRTEAELLTNTPISDTDSLLKNVSSLPAKMKLVTDGHKGSYFYNGTSWMWSDSFKVERVETTGAGDAYGSAFVAGLVKNLNDEQRFKLAAANAASVVSHPGAKEGILRENQVEEWMSKELEFKSL